MKRILSVVIFSAVILLMCWLVISFIDINLHNDPHMSGYRDFADWNFFILVHNFAVAAKERSIL